VCSGWFEGGSVKVRIKKTPAEKEIDGVPLKGMLPGTVRDVSPELATWLIAEEYADAEMRQQRNPADDELDRYFMNVRPFPRDRRAQKS
jgi:hypothetical protein